MARADSEVSEVTADMDDQELEDSLEGETKISGSPPIPTFAVFALICLMSIGGMVASITSFDVVTKDSVEDAVESTITNNLRALKANVESVLVNIQPTAKMMAMDIVHSNEKCTDVGISSLERQFALQLLYLEGAPLIAFNYQSYRWATGPNIGHWTDCGCGNYSGYYYCTRGTENLDDLITEGMFPPDMTVVDSYFRDPTDEIYIQGIAHLDESHKDGFWQETSPFYDVEVNATTLLASFSVPLEFDPVTGLAVHAFTIDVALNFLGQMLAEGLVGGQNLIIVDALRDRLVADTMGLDFNATVLDDPYIWPADNTPDSQTNSIVREIKHRFGSIANVPDNFFFDYEGLIVSAISIRDQTGTLHWTAIETIPRSYYFSKADETRKSMLIVASLVGIVTIVICVIVYFALMNSVSSMSDAMKQLAGLHPVTNVKPPVLLELRAMHVSFVRMNSAIELFTRYVPKDVIRQVMAAGGLASRAMRTLDCTILFVDIEKFTTMCEAIPPDQFSKSLTLYMSLMSDIVMQHGGMIDKYIGDCILGVWGAPLPMNMTELRASLCGLLMLYTVRANPLHSVFANLGVDLNVRVGIHSGPVLVGNIGSAKRINYTVLGDPVNVAARLEALNKEYKTRLMVSGVVQEKISAFCVTRFLGEIAPRGKVEMLPVYEVQGMKAECYEEPLEALRDMGASCENYLQKEASFDTTSVLSLGTGPRNINDLLRKACECCLFAGDAGDTNTVVEHMILGAETPQGNEEEKEL